jgi:allantoin racemase
MRIWHQSMAPLGEFGQYANLLEEHIERVAAKGTIVTLHGARPGSYLGRAPGELLRYPYARHLIHSHATRPNRKATTVWRLPLLETRS